MDNAASTPIHPEVLNFMIQILREDFGNPSALHNSGRKAHILIEDARRKIAEVINAEPDEIYFTSGGTEADNWAIFGAFNKFAGSKNPVHIITSKIEHKAVLKSCKALERLGAEITYLDVDGEGFVNPKDVKSAVRDNTILISIMTANNEIGTIEPIEEIGKIAHKSKILFHTDAVQAFAKEIIDVRRMNIDYLSASSHKIYGSKGAGFLYMRKGKNLPPLIYGGSQERNRRAGTENVAGIAGFGMAAEISFLHSEKWNEHERRIRDKMISGLLEIYGCTLNGSKLKRLANNIHVSIKGVESESLVLLLNERGIAAGTGSACSSGLSEASHVLKAIGHSHADSFGGLRLTINYMTTDEEADYVISCVKECVERLRGEK